MFATRYSGVVKLQGVPGSVGSTPGTNTTTRAKEIVMPLQFTCSTCGKAVLRRPNEVLKRVFCSRRCYWDARAYSHETHFYPKIDRSGGEDACWRWTGRVDADGYGLCGPAGSHWRSHRLAWELANGTTVPAGLLIRHLCPGGGNPWCCNPKHLTPGTVKENAADAMAAGRLAQGERVKLAKLTAEAVREIRRRRADGETCRQIARDLGVSNQVISQIVKRQTWKHVS
jgi:hypothetical protein